MDMKILIKMERHSISTRQINGHLVIDGRAVKVDPNGGFLHSAENFDAFWLDVTRAVRKMAFLKAGADI